MPESHLAVLTDILTAKLQIPQELITLEATVEDVELDSLAMVELSILLQHELGISISDDELGDARTVGNIVRLMDERRVRP